MSARPAKTQISLGIRPVWSESSLSARRKLGSLATPWAHSEDSDQTGRMPRLIWVFAGRPFILLVLSCRGSDNDIHYERYETKKEQTKTRKPVLSPNEVITMIKMTIHSRATTWQNQQNVCVCPAKSQISLGIRPVRSESSLCVHWVAMTPRFLHADSEDSDHIGRIQVDIILIENARLSRTSLWRYMYAPKCYVSCGHTIFITSRYPLNNSDVIW